ncbi:Ribonuclease P protein subunit [Lachnellula subtilissima]|uniref:Ribonuclease P protein subunit n=1 Tax=Lachnellula subtilissima TaxID=602034 RepID=A0A8H8S1Q6_9HELO|nr:Ribonuclease P protein subunit [Lachnellula subtilissima]
MAKAKAAKGTANVPNKILHSRVSYLYQAASYLAAQQPHSESGPTQYEKNTNKTPSNHPESIETNGAQHSSSTTTSEAAYRPAARRMISDLRSVTLKGQMRISPTMKHSICKKCDTLLIDASTCTNEVENKSKEGKKPWADVLVLRCYTCGLEKRFPVAAKRQKRRPKRTLSNEIQPEGNRDG